MFNISIEIKQGSAVLFERFLANLWSKKSSFWLRRCQLYNNLFGVYLIDPTAEKKALNLLEERICILPSTILGLRLLSRNNSQCLSIAITKSYQRLKAISIMINIGLHWTIFILQEFIRKIPPSYHRGFLNQLILRPRM